MKIELINYTLLHPSQHEDLLKIRNMEYIRKNMKSNEYIELENHLNWVDKKKSDASSTYYGVSLNDILVGGISLTQINQQNSTTEWGIFFKKNSNPLIPSISLYLLLEKVFYTMRLNKVNLEVKTDNLLAYKFDKSFGFKNTIETQNKMQYVKMHLTKELWEEKKKTPLFQTLEKKIKTINYNWKD